MQVYSRFRCISGLSPKQVASVIFRQFLIGSCIGVFIGYGIYVFWDFRTHPDLYAMRSAPWYTSILVYGIFTIAISIVLVIIKLIVRRKLE